MKTYFILLLLVVPAISSCQDSKRAGKINLAKDAAARLEYYNKGLSEYENNSFASAISALNNALEITYREDSLYSMILFLRSGSYMKTDKLDSAIMDLELLVQSKPGDINYLINLSYLYGETHRFPESIATLEKAKTIDDSNLSIYSNLAYYSAEAGAYDNAVKYAEKGLTLTKDKDSVSIGALLNNLGFAQSKVVSIQKGFQTIAKSISFFPRNPFAYFNMGRIFLDIHEKEKACSNFMKARDLGGIIMTEEYIKMYCK
jgi:tetratricopeptide (TPR) repeat protein